MLFDYSITTAVKICLDFVKEGFAKASYPITMLDLFITWAIFITVAITIMGREVLNQEFKA